ncbi:MAG TPA: methyltransferase domain-containing protein [Solirubrobacterales bacterium]|nr:methyltransferase domain-containing protein [Solirubrobacterales bacterium]
MIKRLLLLAALAFVGAALWWRKNPSACPYSQRFWVDAPHPLITRDRLAEVLGPLPAERILEIGPGTGYYTLDMAGWVPDGVIEIFDLQQEMLDHTMERVREAGIGNVTATQGDATELPYADDSFDAVVLITVLGEIADREAAIAEIARVLKPGGRLVAGELFGDPHYTTPGDLTRLGAGAGLGPLERTGPLIGYFGRLEKPAASASQSSSSASST